jgi:nitroreductase
MEQGAWLDQGMLLQSVMLIAGAFGLDTNAQTSFDRYCQIIAERLV